MNLTQKLLLTFSISITLIALVILFNPKAQLITGSVNSANEYQSTTTRQAFNGVPLGNPIILSTDPGALGSVVVTGTNTGTINFYDATSTVQHSDYATTTLASIPASATVGTYTFDVRTTRGLVMEIIGTVGTSTVTYR